MNLFSELQRLWGLDTEALKLCPVEKVVTGQVPDKYADKDGNEQPLNVPYICLWSPDGSPADGTSQQLGRNITVQCSCFGSTRAQAERMRTHARGLFEDCDIQLDGINEIFQDISLDTDGELPPRDGVYELFQRFIVETSIPRPRRKRV